MTTGSSQNVIEVRGLAKAFGPKVVLDGISFRVREGQSYVIIGPSGCGKSVTLKIIMGLLRPDGGRVLLYGRDVTDLPESEFNDLRKKMGMVFQLGALFDSLTVGENVGFALEQHTDMNSRERAQRVAQCLDWVGLPGIEDKVPSELSGGMRKRVSLARAIALEPDILLYDEPTTGLDPIMTAEIDRLINRMQDRLSTTCIIVTHDLKSAYRTGDYIGVLHEGRLVFAGTPDEVRNSEHPFVRQFLEGRPNEEEVAA